MALVGFGWDPNGCSMAICFSVMPQQYQKLSWQHQHISFPKPNTAERVRASTTEKPACHDFGLLAATCCCSTAWAFPPPMVTPAIVYLACPCPRSQTNTEFTNLISSLSCLSRQCHQSPNRECWRLFSPAGNGNEVSPFAKS